MRYVDSTLSSYRAPYLPGFFSVPTVVPPRVSLQPVPIFFPSGETPWWKAAAHAVQRGAATFFDSARRYYWRWGSAADRYLAPYLEWGAMHGDTLPAVLGAVIGGHLGHAAIAAGSIGPGDGVHASSDPSSTGGYAAPLALQRAFTVPPAPDFATALAMVRHPESVVNGGTDLAAVHRLSCAAFEVLGAEIIASLRELGVSAPEQEAQFWLASPFKHLTAIILLAMGLPSGLVEARCLEFRPTQGSAELMDRLRRVAIREAVQQACAVVRTVGLRTWLSHVAPLYEEAARAMQETSVSGELHVDLGEPVIAGAIYFAAKHAEWYALAAANGHWMGGEIEFDPRRWTERNDDHRLASRDEVLLAVCATLSEQDIPAVPVEGEPYFHIRDDTPAFPTVTDHYEDGGVRVAIKRLAGTGCIIIDARNMRTGEVRVVPIDAAHFNDRVVSREASRLAREMFARVGVEPDLLHQMWKGEDLLYMFKDAHHDIAKVLVFMDRERKTARLVGLNVLFGDVPEVTIHDITAFSAVETWVRERAKDPQFLKKTDKYKSLWVAGVGEFKLTYEQHPFLEFVTPTVTPENFHVVRGVLEALQHKGYIGTTMGHTVGVHFHSNTPVIVRGKYSIAPPVNLLQEYLRHEEAIEGIVPIENNRRGFISRARYHLRRRLLALNINDPAHPNYVDPADPDVIMCIIADWVASAPKKYSAINPDNVFSHLLQHMLRDGKIAPTKPTRPRHVRWFGREYVFHITAVFDDPNPDNHVYDIMVEVNGHAHAKRKKKKRLHLIRFRDAIPTVEFRIPNTIQVNPEREKTHIDPSAVMTLMEWFAALGYGHGYGPFVPGPIQPPPSMFTLPHELTDGQDVQ